MLLHLMFLLTFLRVMYVHAVLVADFVKLIFHVERRILNQILILYYIYIDVTSVLSTPLIMLHTVCFHIIWYLIL